jgi:DNA-binding CsgD family transcriptional regulator
MRQYLDPPDGWQARAFLEQVAFVDEVNRSVRYREVLATQGFSFDLRCVYALDGMSWGGISVFRERGSPDFTDREAALVRRLSPHLAAGLKAAMLRFPVPNGATVPSGPGVLMLDRRGRVIQHTPAAEYWLRQLTNLPAEWREGQGLPAVVWVAVAKLQQGLLAETIEGCAQVPRIWARTRMGVWIQLQAALGEGQDGQLGDTVIVIEPLGPREISWLRLAAYDLSPREQEVVDLIIRGASTRQIAQALCIAEYTVQDHLKHIFDKTGVHSRRELVQRLYLDSLPHAIQTEVRP